MTDLSDLSEKNVIFKNNYNLEFECKGYLIFPVLARLWVKQQQGVEIHRKIC